MEVSGRRLADSSSKATPPCDHCAIVNDHTSSSSYCIDCNEFLCTKCCKQHRFSMVFRTHSLLDEQVMPEKKLSVGNINVCPKDGEIVEFYCANHKLFICADCLSVNHGTCKALEIKAMAKNFETSQQYTSLKSNLDYLLGTIDEQMDNIDDIKSAMTKYVSDALFEIQTFRTELNSRLDALEKEICSELERFETTNDELLSLKKTNLMAIETELSELVSRINEQERFCAIDLLVISTTNANMCMQQYQNSLKYIVKQLDEIRKEHALFVRNDNIHQNKS